MSYLGPSLRRRRRALRPWTRAAAALALALALNALVVTQVKTNWAIGKGPPRSVSMAGVSAAQWAANRTIRDPSVPPAPPVAIPRPPEPVRTPGQVVDVAPSSNNAAPANTRFVSDRNNTVEKETRSKHARAGYENVLAKPSQPEAPDSQTRNGGQGGEEGNRTASKGKKGLGSGFALEVPDQQRQDRLALQFDPFGEYRNRDGKQGIDGNGKSLDVRPIPNAEAGGGGRAGKRGPKDIANLAPTSATFDRLSGGPAPDRLDGIEEGEGTYLNTREWKYATYFNRIKQAVANHWDPNAALRIRDPDGSMFAYKDRVTVVGVVLDDHGTLKDVVVEKTCGVDFIDSSALQAFRRAQPFVNPPKGLVDSHGEIKFTFGFYLEVGSPGLRLFRAPTPEGR
jgi:TonB family protein